MKTKCDGICGLSGMVIINNNLFFPLPTGVTSAQGIIGTGIGGGAERTF